MSDKPISTKSREINMSATRMSTYLTCKWKYWCNYVLKMPKKANASFKLGIAAHEALAKAGEIWMKKEKFTSNDIKLIKDEYRSVAAKQGLENMTIYDDGLEMVLNRLDSFDVGRIITIEDNFKITTDEGVTIIGAMDRIVELDEETILIVDYKTSKYHLTQDELKSDVQLSVYDLVGSLKFPNYKRMILSLDYLRDEPVYTYRTAKERKTFAQYIAAVHKEMMCLQEHQAKPAINDLCNWCDFNDSCPDYKEFTVDRSIFKKNLNEYTDDEIVEEYLNVKSKSRILYEYEKQLKTHIFNKISDTATDLIGGGKQIYIRQNGNMNYDADTVSKHVPKKDFLKMVNIGKKHVDEYMRAHPEVRPYIMETAQKNFTAPFLAYKTIKK